VSELALREATPADSAAIAEIYNQGIEDRMATFETEPRTPTQVRERLASLGRQVALVAAREGEVVGFAWTSPYRPRPCYSGIGEFSVYVARDARRSGVGRALLHRLLSDCEARGFWKLVSRIFPENTASRLLCRSLGFREVGVYERHGRLDGVWRDCVIVERLLGFGFRPGPPPHL
jgi:phosphinothricin acetyltransferase